MTTTIKAPSVLKLLEKNRFQPWDEYEQKYIKATLQEHVLEVLDHAPVDSVMRLRAQIICRIHLDRNALIRMIAHATEFDQENILKDLATWPARFR